MFMLIRMATNGYLPFLILILSVCSKTGTATCGTYVRTDKNVYTIGEIIHLTCSTRYPPIPDPSQFYIMHYTRQNLNGTKVSAPLNVTENGVSTDIKVRNKSDAGTYICYYGNCKNTLLTSFKSVRVIDIPSNLKKPKLDCVTDSHWNTACTWDAVDNQSNIAWKMAFKQEGTGRVICCTSPTNACDRYSSENTCYISNKEFKRYSTYQIQLTANYGDNNTFVYYYTIRTNDSLLRCHIGDSLQLFANVRRQLDLKTGIDCVPSAISGVVCHVIAVSRRKPHDTVSKNFTSYSDELNVHGIISGLDQFTSYNVSLKCRPNVSRHWSNTLYAVASTLPEPPTTPPEVMGYSEIDRGQNRRDVILYIKPTGRFYGREPQYAIDFDTSSESTSLVFDIHDATSEIRSLESSQTYRLRIIPQNEAGSSINSTVFDIPQSMPVRELTVVADKSNASTILNLFWNEALEEAKTTCYFTCSTDDEIVPPKCKTLVARQCIDGFRSSYVIPVLHDNKAYTAYGVSLENNNKTDYIVWSTCIFHPEIIHAWDNLPVTGKLVNHSTVELALGFDYCRLQKRPLVYQIEVLDERTNQNCSFQEARNITATPKLKSIPIDVSGHKQRLVICFRVLYSSDSSDLADDITAMALEIPDAATKGLGGIKVIIGTTTGVAVCFLILLLYCLKRYRRMLQSRNQVKDILKDIVLPGKPETVKEHAAQHDSDISHCSGDEGEDNTTYIQLQDTVKGSLTQLSASIAEAVNTEPQAKEAQYNKADQKHEDTYDDRKFVDKYAKLDENQNGILKAVIDDTDKRDVSTKCLTYLDSTIQRHDFEQKKKLMYYLHTLSDQHDTKIITVHNYSGGQESSDYVFGTGGDVTDMYDSARTEGVVGNETPGAGTPGTCSSNDSQVDSYAVVINIMGSGPSLPDDYIISTEMTSS